MYRKKKCIDSGCSHPLEKPTFSVEHFTLLSFSLSLQSPSWNLQIKPGFTQNKKKKEKEMCRK